MSESMSDILERLSALKTELANLGVAPEKIDALLPHIDAYASLRADLIAGRDTQFEEDARDLALSIQSASNKNIAKIAAYLRKFAEHVAEQVIGMTVRSDDIETTVDYIECMTEE